jgi:hypothetical protein
MPNGKPNILVMWGDDIGQFNLSCYSHGVMGYRTPNIDRIAREGMMFTDYYGEQSCTAGRASFITGQCGLRTGLTKVGLPGSDLGTSINPVDCGAGLLSCCCGALDASAAAGLDRLSPVSSRLAADFLSFGRSYPMAARRSWKTSRSML